MFDSKKIDDYFEGKTSIVLPQKVVNQNKFSFSRVVKLVFPCLAATILGMMIVFPNIKKNVDIQDDITLPRKNEMEKLHVEEVVFNTTDKKNRVSTVWADNMDEQENNTDEIKIVNPRADIPSDNGIIKVSADTGFMNQQIKILSLKENVVAKDEKNNIVHTPSATYEFEKEYGYGNDEVQAEGDWGNLTSQGFNYDKNSAVLTLLGLTVIEAENGTLISNTETKYFQNENKIISVGKAVAKKDDKTLKADKIINYLTDGSKKELKKTEAFGNVEIITPKGIVRGNRANYDVATGSAEVFGNVIITSDKGVAKGDRAVYDSDKNTVDLYGNVVLEQGDNFMHGNHAHTDLSASVSTMVADDKKGARVSGIFYKKTKGGQ